MSTTDSWLFLLPRGYLVNIFSEWLDISDVGRLDTAITNHNYRLQFLDDLVTMRSTTVDGHLFDGGFYDTFSNPVQLQRRKRTPGCSGGMWCGEGILGTDDHYEERIKSFDQLQWLSRRRIHVEEMEVAFINSSKFGHLRFPSLRKLRIDTATGYGAVEMSVVEFIKSSPALSKLSIIGYIGGTSYHGDDNSYVGGSVKGFGMLLRALAHHCPTLEEFTLESPFESYESYNSPTEHHVDDLRYLFRHAKALRDICFTGSVFRCMQDRNDDDEEIEEDGCCDDVRVFADFGHLFKSIILICDGGRNSIHGKMQSERFFTFISTCSRLKQLHYRQVDNNGRYLLHIAKSCPLIEDVKTNSWSDKALQQLSQSCKNLRSLTIEPHEVPAKINTDCLKLLNQIDTLQELDLPICTLTDLHIIAISSISTIKKLTLTIDGVASEGFTGVGFESFIGAPISHSLQEIKVNVPTCAKGKLALVKGLAACQKLLSVWLMEESIDNEQLDVLGGGCPLLEKIRMHCRELTFDGLMSFIMSKAHLHRFVLWRQSQFATVGDGENVRIREQDIDLLRSRFPKVEFQSMWEY